ncbi:MAG TPA: hypothetical protein P5125_01485 [Kiritimatiellia bacterium]|jgi:hypothetical protein|nr:hypothetical protein [Candidatus Latescibacterota bacterium]HOR97646.1 hypothetical protein [Kiritimatiellia bacterium]HPK76007.1 hypothetical protein [Candidatus Latescibacterota bacterium]HRU19004.1 hypothetical protein [Kiritimatiellia bacterium]
MKTLVLIAVSVAAFGLFAAEDICFAAGKWDQKAWWNVANPRWNYRHGFEQAEDCILNECPGTKIADWYSAMVMTNRFSEAVSISARMSFDDRFAPGILIAPELVDGPTGKELRDHFEIILFDGGINVWRYKWTETGFVITKPAFVVTPFAPRTPLTVTVTIKERNVVGGGKTRQMTVTCGSCQFGFRSDDLPASFYAGINGNEGRCRFYSFGVGD